jgi:hypothetical protein
MSEHICKNEYQYNTRYTVFSRIGALRISMKNTLKMPLYFTYRRKSILPIHYLLWCSSPNFSSLASIDHLPTVNNGRRASETCPPIAIGLDPDTPVCFPKALHSWLDLYWYYGELR